VRTPPDILVLGGGGVLGGAWMSGVLAGIEDAAGIDLRGCEYFLGTSAGAILAALLSAGQRPERPSAEGGPGSAADAGNRDPASSSPAPAQDGGGAVGASGDGDGAAREAIDIQSAALAFARMAGAWALALGSPLAPLALRAGAGPGALARAALLRSTPSAGSELVAVRELVERAGARFDGRLRVVAVDRASGRRVVFGRPGAPDASPAAAVEASCSLPWLFAPVRIGGREYVDGGVWSPTNLDAAPAGRGSQVLCLCPLAALGGVGASPALTLGRAATRTAVALEELALRRRGARVRTIFPDAASAAAIGQDLMARKPRAHVLAAGYRQGMAIASGESRMRRERALG
jgi:NTE family protein